MDDDKYFVDTNFAMCLHYNAPIGSPYPQMYDPFNGNELNFDNKSTRTLTELGYPKLEIIGQWAAVIYIGLIAAWIFIF